MCAPKSFQQLFNASSSSLITHYLQRKWRDLRLRSFSPVNVCSCLHHSIPKAAGRAPLPLLLQAGAALKPRQVLRDLPSSDLENSGLERRHNLSVLPVLPLAENSPPGEGLFSHPARNLSCSSSCLLSTCQGTFSIYRTRQS